MKKELLKKMKNKQKYPCIETTLDYERGPFVIRLWLNETEIGRKVYPEIIKTIDELCGLNSMPPEITEYDQYLKNIYNLLIEKLSQIPNINAFQIIRKDRYYNVSWGTVVYTVDFSEDVHG